MAQVPEPHISVAKLIYDFGKVEQGAVIEAPFDIRNDGQVALEIQRVLPACGCTVAEAEKKILQPGESTKLLAKFDTKGFFGKKTKTIRIYTNDPKNYSTLLSIRGEVLREFSIEPGRFYYGEVLLGDSPTVEVALKANKPGIQFGEIASKTDHLNISFSDTQSAGKVSRVIKATLKPDAPLGILRSLITVKSNSTQEPVIGVPVFAKVRGDLQFTPSYVSFDLLEGPLEWPVTKVAELKNISDDKPQIVKIESTNPQITGSVREIVQGRLFEISVTIAQGASGVVRGQLTLVTNRQDKARQNVTLPVYAVITKKGQ